MQSLPNISILNHHSFERFNNVISILFEPAIPLANALYDKRPFTDYDQMLKTAAQIIAELSESERMHVVNAHPRLGEKKLSSLSALEQGSILDSDAIDKKLAALNFDYENKHGFKVLLKN